MICPILIEYLNKILYLHLKYLRSTTIQLIYELLLSFDFEVPRRLFRNPDWSGNCWLFLVIWENLLSWDKRFRWLIWSEMFRKSKVTKKYPKRSEFWRNHLFWSGHVGPEKSKQATKIFTIFNFSQTGNSSSMNS